ncbi:hypothetical protein PSCFBP2116_02210 [Pseudomonas syringae]|uniref:Uncharacterized protein n=1 Tax=Pseudomonas syringae TaxID=317 RepID=A0A2K4WWY3_PSESX|nr:hypothetical protein CFBP3840_03334 [Pseudomonas syringae]SPD81727.1 hypothetical protein PSCFBP2116_02210 [Pseudomonas syringae]
MNSALNALLPSLILLGTSYSAAAYSDVPDDIPSNDCYWISPPGIKDYRRDIGTLYVPKDAAVGTFIGSIDMLHATPRQTRQVWRRPAEMTARLFWNSMQRLRFRYFLARWSR